MVEVEHTPDVVFLAPEPTAAQCGRDLRGMWHHFVRDAPFRRAMAWALYRNDAGKMARLLRFGARPDTRFAMGAVPLSTALDWAVTQKDHAMAAVLLAAGATPSLRSGTALHTPLCVAAYQADQPMCELLLQHGARWEEFGRDVDGRWLSALGEALRTPLAGWARQSAQAQASVDAAASLDLLLAPADALPATPRSRL